MLLLVVHLAAVGYLTGLAWVVQLVVYPGFRTVGPAPAWPGFHDAHSRAMGRAVGLPWAVQGATLALLLLRPPDGAPAALVLLAAALGLAPVAVTVLAAVPLHTRLAPYDERRARRLLAVHAARTAAWTAGLAVAAALLLAAAQRHT